MNPMVIRILFVLCTPALLMACEGSSEPEPSLSPQPATEIPYRQEEPADQSAEKVDPLVAYTRLLESEDFPKDTNPLDQRNLAAVQSDPGAIRQQLIADISFQQRDDSRKTKALAMFSMVPDPAMQLDIARQVVASYPIGRDVPLLQFLAKQGDLSDMQRITAEINADPDGTAVGLAIAIVESNDAAKIEILRDLKTETPGAWRGYVKDEKTDDYSDPSKKN